MADDFLDYDPGVSDKDRAKNSDRLLQEVYDQGRTDASSSGSSTSRQIPNATRKVVGLMAVAVIFSLVGNELKNAEGDSSVPQKAVGTLSTGAKIIIGGTVATAILSFATEAGPAGQQFGVGIATIAVVTSLFVSGAPVWRAISNVVGSTGPTGSSGITYPTAQGFPTNTTNSVGYQSTGNLPTIVGNQNVTRG